MSVKYGRCFLGDILRDKGWRQTDLADRSSKSTTQISDYIHGRKYMSFRTAVEFATILGCHAEDLYEWIHGE